VIATTDVAGTVAFYRRHFPLAPAFDSGWYVHLVWPGQPAVNLAVVDCRHESIPERFRRPAQGMLINFELEDVDGAYERLRSDGAPVVLTLRDEPWGQRHFMVEDPNGLLLDVIKPIPPDATYRPFYLQLASAR
jgi:catechol 2,3-dioxygenase-like lactoylglutathione lyase family enzyme